ncbi:MAG: NfeD family protein [Desulfurococcaceae archaeon]
MLNARYSIIILTMILLLPSFNAFYYTSSDSPRNAVYITFDVSIDGGAVSYIDRVSSKYRGRVAVIEFRSYGGFLSAADKIISLLEENNITCIAWIPRDGYAVSAAAYIALYCSRIYIAPGGVIGGIKPEPYNQKVVEYVKARLRSFLSGRNITNLSSVIDELVDEAKHYSSREASDIGLATEVSNIDDILEKENIVLTSREKLNLWDRLVSVLSYPLISSLMLLVGVILILIEIYTTGFQGYGIAGALLIVLALYSMYLVPLEILHLSLILAGAVLLGVEVATPGFGAFGIAGLALTALGIALVTISLPQSTPSVVYPIAGVLVATAGFFLIIGFSAAKTTRMKKKNYKEQLERAVGIAKTDINETYPGVAYVLNEDWTAYSLKGRIPAGSRVRVVRVEGLKIYVERVEE